MQTSQVPEVPNISVPHAMPWQDTGTATWAQTSAPPFIRSASSSELVQTHHFQQPQRGKTPHPGRRGGKATLCIKATMGSALCQPRLQISIGFIDINPCMCFIQPNCCTIISNAHACPDLICHVPAFLGTNLKTKIKLDCILKITPWVILYSKLFILKQD